MLFLPSFKHAFPAILLGVLLLFGQVNQAWADPHAVFYTATGQQQLFFNVLAALDQADYVEPAESTTGTPAGLSRAELLKDRTAAGFGAETDTALKATKTKLAGVVTRSITLEGNDLWSSYLTLQFALEVTRRRNTDEIVRIFCERGLGLPNCENTNKDVAKKIEKQEQAYVRDPNKVTANPTLRGSFSALLSGLPGQQEDARETLKETVGDNEPSLPLAYDSAIADWWKAAQRNKGANVAAHAALATMLTHYPVPVNGAIWDYVDVKDNGGVELKSHNDLVAQGILPSSFTATANAQDPAETFPLDPDTLNGHEALVAMALNNSAGLRSSAEAAAERYEAQTDETTVDGAVPDVSLNTSAGNDKDIGEIGILVKTPAHAKVAVTKAVTEGVLDAEQNTKFVVTDSENTPGTVQSVERQVNEKEKQALGTSGAGSPQVSGATTQQPAGAILGIISEEPGEDPTHHSEVKALPPDSNLTGFHHEQGPAHLLQAVGHGSDRGGCGCSAQTATNHFGANIIRRIIGF